MRSILVACMALATITVAGAQSVRAQAVVIEAHPYYWQEHHDLQWQKREEFKDAEASKDAWAQQHCVRDWEGHALCRR